MNKGILEIKWEPKLGIKGHKLDIFKNYTKMTKNL